MQWCCNSMGWTIWGSRPSWGARFYIPSQTSLEAHPSSKMGTGAHSRKQNSRGMVLTSHPNQHQGSAWTEYISTALSVSYDVLWGILYPLSRMQQPSPQVTLTGAQTGTRQLHSSTRAHMHSSTRAHMHSSTRAHMHSSTHAHTHSSTRAHM